MEAIAAIARKAGTREAAQCVCAMGEHIARTLFAFVLICNAGMEGVFVTVSFRYVSQLGQLSGHYLRLTFVHAIAAAVAVIAMADAVQTRAMCALGAILITVICRKYTNMRS